MKRAADENGVYPIGTIPAPADEPDDQKGSQPV